MCLGSTSGPSFCGTVVVEGSRNAVGDVPFVDSSEAEREHPCCSLEFDLPVRRQRRLKAQEKEGTTSIHPFLSFVSISLVERDISRCR